MALEEKTLRCRDCGQEFVFTTGEQEFLSIPRSTERASPLLTVQVCTTAEIAAATAADAPPDAHGHGVPSAAPRPGPLRTNRRKAGLLSAIAYAKQRKNCLDKLRTIPLIIEE